MCIIAYKPERAAFPTKATLAECFRNNPDGAGFMYSHDGAVIIQKGFATFSAFWAALRAARAAVGDRPPFVLHFRISTQAGTRADCCHPFPLSEKMDDLRALRCACKIGIAHNGIIWHCSSAAANVTYSDTMRFITEYAALIIRGFGYYKRPATLELLKRLAGSRLAILDARGHCELIGDGWTEDGGVYYSNGSYKPKKTTTAGFFGDYCGGGYDWTPYADEAEINDDSGLFSEYMTDADEEPEMIEITRAGAVFTVCRCGDVIALYDDGGDLLDEGYCGDSPAPLEELADSYFSPWWY